MGTDLILQPMKKNQFKIRVSKSPFQNKSCLILRQASKKLHVTFIVARNSTSAYFCALIHVLIRYFASGLDKCTLVYPGHLPWVFKLTSRFTTFAA